MELLGLLITKRMSLTERTEDTEKRGIMGVKKGIYLTPDK